MLFAQKLLQDQHYPLSDPSTTLRLQNISLDPYSLSAALFIKIDQKQILIIELQQTQNALKTYQCDLKLANREGQSLELVARNGDLHVIGWLEKELEKDKFTQKALAMPIANGELVSPEDSRLNCQSTKQKILNNVLQQRKLSSRQPRQHKSRRSRQRQPSCSSSSSSAYQIDQQFNGKTIKATKPLHKSQKHRNHKPQQQQQQQRQRQQRPKLLQLLQQSETGEKDDSDDYDYDQSYQQSSQSDSSSESQSESSVSQEVEKKDQNTTVKSQDNDEKEWKGGYRVPSRLPSWLKKKNDKNEVDQTFFGR